MQLALDALDRLIELIEEQGGRIRASEAARHLLAVRTPPEGLARLLLAPLVERDSRLRWRGAFIALSAATDPPLAEADFVVFDLETTGLAGPGARICEIGAVRIETLEPSRSFETLVASQKGVSLRSSSLTGLTSELLRGAPDA